MTGTAKSFLSMINKPWFKKGGKRDKTSWKSSLTMENMSNFFKKMPHKPIDIFLKPQGKEDKNLYKFQLKNRKKRETLTIKKI